MRGGRSDLPSVEERDRLIAELLRLRASGRLSIGPIWYGGRYLKTRDSLFDYMRLLEWSTVRGLVAGAIAAKGVQQESGRHENTMDGQELEPIARTRARRRS